MSAYGTNDGFTAWLDANGLTLPTGAPPPAVLREIGSVYVDGAYEYALQCSRRTGGFSQELAWPRTGHSVNGDAVPSDLIPQAWINASYRAAYLTAATPGWAQGGQNPNRITKREKAGEVEREFFGAGEGAVASRAAPGFNVDPLIDGWLAMWLCPTGRNPNSLFLVI